MRGALGTVRPEGMGVASKEVSGHTIKTQVFLTYIKELYDF